MPSRPHPNPVVVLSRSKTVLQQTPSAPRPPRKKKKPDILRWVVVTGGALVMTASFIYAADIVSVFKGINNGTTQESISRCPADMAFVPTANGGFCIDRYEDSTGDACPMKDPTSGIQTNENMAISLCMPVSQQGRTPWVNASLSQAIALCAKAGKRLPTPGEWYRAALGTPDVQNNGKYDCVLGRVGVSQAEKTGTNDRCVSSFGAYDMLGNVWEWVDANVTDGEYNGRELPPDGYVTEADIDGVPVQTGTTSSEVFGDDYFFNEPTGVHGMFRGGFWNLSDKAGIFTINATIQPSFTGSAVGFRCVR